MVARAWKSSEIAERRFWVFEEELQGSIEDIQIKNMVLIVKVKASYNDKEKLRQNKESSSWERRAENSNWSQIVVKYSFTASERLLWAEVLGELIKK